MSAPPIGSTKRTPNNRAPQINAITSAWRCGPARTTIARATSAAISARFTTFCPGYTIGRPLTSSCSLPNATRLPANDTLPISADNMIEMPTSA